MPDQSFWVRKALLKCWLPIDGRNPMLPFLFFMILEKTYHHIEDGISELRSNGFKVYALDMKVPCPEQNENPRRVSQKFFRNFTLELLQVIAYVKYLEAGTPPFLLTQGLGVSCGSYQRKKTSKFCERSHLLLTDVSTDRKSYSTGGF